MKKLLLIGAIIAGVVLLPKIARVTLAEDATAVLVTVADHQPIQRSVLASGHLRYKQEIELRSEVIGKVSDIYIIEGQRVKAGDPLLQIELETLAATVEQQEASVNLQQIEIERQQILIDHKRSDLARQKKLYERQLMGEAAYEQIELELDLAQVDLRSKQESLVQAKAALQQAQEQLAKTSIVSPINGLVTTLDVKEGETVISGAVNIIGSRLIKVADTSEMMAEIFVDEADVSKVAPGQAVKLEAISFPGEVMVGEIRSMAIAPDYHGKDSSLSFKIKVGIHPDAAITNFRPGISCRAEIITQTSNEYLSVPVAAVLYGRGNEGQDYVYVMEEGRAQRRSVTLGISDDLNQAILSGLNIGDEVITGPYRTLRELKEGQAVSTNVVVDETRQLVAD